MDFTSIVGTGQTVTEEIITSGTQLLNGSALNCTISISGIQQNINGQTTNTKIISGGVQHINGGKAFHSKIKGLVQDSGHVSSYQVVGQNSLSSDTKLENLGYQYIYGGSATDTKIKSGGIQVISSGLADITTINKGIQFLLAGSATNTTINTSGEQILLAGLATNTTINKGGLQHISAGKTKTTTLNQGTQIVWGEAIHTTIKNGGCQIISQGSIKSGSSKFTFKGKATSTTITARSLQQLRGGEANKVTISKGGSQYVYAGTTKNVTLLTGAMQYISGGRAQDVQIAAKASQILSQGQTTNVHVSNGGVQYVYGGKSLKTTLEKGGLQQVYKASAHNTTVLKGATQQVLQSGRAQKSKIKGVLVVVSGGKALDCTLFTSGQGAVLKGGLVQNVTVKKGGLLVASSGAKVRDIELLGGAQLSIAAKNVLGGTNTFTHATAFGGNNSQGVQLDSKASLVLKEKNNLGQFHLKVGSGTLALQSSNNTLGLLNISNKSRIDFSLSTLKPVNKPLLTLLNTNTSYKGIFSIKVKNGQKLGTYVLTKNWQPTKTPSFSLYLDKKKRTSLKLDGPSVTLRGVRYSLTKDDNEIKLTLAKKSQRSAHQLNGKISQIHPSALVYSSTPRNLLQNLQNQNEATNTSPTYTTVTSADNGFTTQKYSTIHYNTTILSQTSPLKDSHATKVSLLYPNRFSTFDRYLKSASPTDMNIPKAPKETWQKAILTRA